MAHTAETITERATTKALYTARELHLMSDDALDELLEYYQDKGEHDHADDVQQEIHERADDREAEAAYEAEQERQQQLHDEMVNDMMATDGRWG